jgi:excisionase family DNA binding protein
MATAPTTSRKKFLTTAEVADQLGVSPDHVRKLATEGVLPGVRFRPTGFWRFPAIGVEELLRTAQGNR